MFKPYQRAGGLAVLAAAAALGVAACGGSSSPHVASLGKTSDSTPDSTTTLPKGNPTQLLDEWARCMRSNGVPDMSDPTITSSGAIHITMPADASANAGNSVSRTGGPCGSYLEAASQALRGGQPVQKPDPAKVLKYSQCMQASGFPQFPDPSSTGSLSLQITPGSTMTPSNPAFVNATKSCAKKTGVPAFGNPSSAPRGAIEVQSGSGPGGGPGGNGGAGAVIGSGPGSSGSGSSGLNSGGNSGG
jgi:hypothetical protein